MNNLYLTILITENLFLLISLIIWLTRKCTTCQQVKTIEQIFQFTCQKCHKKQPVKSEKSKSQLEL
ncbi:MAG: hypothetical protein LBR43_02350 [Spiroplasmataceae bacterium]|nr:hypothetical protein [Spiroplasmataceae bacterium]